MAILGSLLLPLGLFLCLGLLCSPASCISHNDNCMLFSKVIVATYSGMHANPNVYKSNTVYTVSVPVNNSISSVVLRAIDQHNSVIGSWQKADKYCSSSVLYHMKSPHSKLFEAKWVSPSSRNITTVELQVFTVDFHNMARVSFKILKRNGTTSDLTTKISTIKPTTAKTPIPTHKLTTTPTHKLTTSPIHKLNTSLTHKLTTTPTHKLTTSPIHKLPPTHKLATTPTHELTTTPTHKLTTSPTHKLTTTPTHKLATTLTHKLTITPTHKLTTTPTQELTTIHKITTTHKLTTTRTTAKSSANRAFLSPMSDAIQILLVFLTSKLLF
ncbi:placenta-expressed transcript 1 protein [Neophocaena asiaeorientalis asiaeorientalis]|uniref:Placenta-expressed transcript 1 protein n=1 Tax=Neophocaena asiaeorientalis asiaeorientalis TaxID=1706337 RepID=A0A341C5D7_NEOAA|nr:placenta-expressed transcript 1 protein [Neophocaena asiaeorientalis asiaeorientalis]